MRLKKIQDYLNQQQIPFVYSENNDCGGLEFTIRGMKYHVWEYPEDARGAASNVRTLGRMEDYENDYEEQIIAVMRAW